VEINNKQKGGVKKRCEFIIMWLWQYKKMDLDAYKWIQMRWTFCFIITQLIVKFIVEFIWHTIFVITRVTKTMILF
jgi:hypothetical protein